jgi:hypothetical protein
MRRNVGARAQWTIARIWTADRQEEGPVFSYTRLTRMSLGIKARTRHAKSTTKSTRGMKVSPSYRAMCAFSMEISKVRNKRRGFPEGF